MRRRSLSMIGIAVVVLVGLLQPAAHAAHAVGAAEGNAFVKRAGPELRLHGKPFRFAGTNNYYLMYKSPAMVDDVIAAAAGNGFRVLRTWGSLEIGNQDGSNSIQGKSDGVYFQYWDGAKPAYNDGADGLQRMDYVIAKAGQAGIKLVIPLVNNWNAFGGMDQYVRWRDTADTSARTWYHDDFYTDPVIRGWYRDWIAHVLNRTNTLTGVKYKDDPAIMTWELGNEPRCVSAGAYGRSASCSTTTLTTWADEMSTHIRALDNKHLISVGDEGFYCLPNAASWIDNCGEGVDTLALTRLPNIDVMSFHLYPDHWGQTTGWGTEWIQRHFRDARSLDKPAMLGEFGLQDKATRNPVYKAWTDAVFTSGGAGALYWILSGKQDDGTLYADYDGFTVYAGEPVFQTLGNFAAMMRANRALVFPPVADHDAATVEFGASATLKIAANDIAYGGATINVGSIDLDPAAAGRQTTLAVPAGTWTLAADGLLSFAPADGFSGKAQLRYTVADSAGRVSNPATATVTVKPNPTGGLLLFGFENDVAGWASASWEAGRATAAQSTAWQTEGAASMEVTVNAGGWFGVPFTPPLDLSGKTTIKFDVKAGGGGTSTDFVVQTGDSSPWRQYSGSWVGGGSTATITIDLLSQGEASDFAKVQTLYLYLQPGTHYIDNIRAE